MSMNWSWVSASEKSRSSLNRVDAPTSVAEVFVCWNADTDWFIGRPVREGLITPCPMYPSALPPTQSGPGTFPSGELRPWGASRIWTSGSWAVGSTVPPLNPGAVESPWARYFWALVSLNGPDCGVTFHSNCDHPCTCPEPEGSPLTR